MLLLMIDKEMPIDIVMFADTGMEFPEMYAHLEKLDAYLYEKRGIHITILRAKHSFEYLMFDEPKVKSKTIENRIQKGIPLQPSRIESRKGFRFMATAGRASGYAGVPGNLKRT